MVRPKATRRRRSSSDGSISLSEIQKLCIVALNRWVWNRWPPRLQVKARCSVSARVGDWKNGRPKFKKMYKCEHCEAVVENIDVNHIEPRISEEGFKTMDEWLERTFVGVDKLEGLCKACHVKLTSQQSTARALKRREKDSEGIRDSASPADPKRRKRSKLKTDSGKGI